MSAHLNYKMARYLKLLLGESVSDKIVNLQWHPIKYGLQPLPPGGRISLAGNFVLAFIGSIRSKWIPIIRISSYKWTVYATFEICTKIWFPLFLKFHYQVTLDACACVILHPYSPRLCKIVISEITPNISNLEWVCFYNKDLDRDYA